MDVIGHAEHLEIEVHGRAVEHAQDKAFAELRRQRRDAQVDVTTGDIFLDAAVLRQAPLGDVHVRHHFDARNDRQREVARRRGHFVKRAVHAIADFEFVLERLEVNVAGAVLDCLIENKIDKADDRRGVRFRFDRSGFIFAHLQQLAGFAELLEDVLHARRLAAVILFDQVLDLIGRRDDNIDIFAKREPQVLARAQIERIDQRKADGVTEQPDRQRAMQPRQSARDQPQNLGRNLAIGKIDKFGAEPFGDGLIKTEFIDEPAVDHRLGDRFAVELGFIEHVVDLRRLQHVLLDKKFGDLFVIHVAE